MAKRYFQLTDDMHLPKRWELGALVDPDAAEMQPALLRSGARLSMTGRLEVSIEEPGRPLDFTHAPYSIPVVHVRVASLLAERVPDEVQFLPVDIPSQPDQYLVLNALRLIRCIDDAHSSEVRYWEPEDGMPEKVGTYFSISGLRIDPTQVGDARMFRTWGWTGALIVSEDLKVALERSGATGMKFTPV
ncbi:hypothetical protein HV824_30460 [Myxococcus sp. AM009]|uniref:imm11 family protein n=1 Tax=unclassified Myxococcus TaxID=2648731 RepID=UPI0015952237|nr:MULTISPECIES: DUF1629 domain-containing protein [unclassified Myxococcus]NVJ02417.1 hypothetical protein [Myxococcus sp. AM009]NVJ19079.1 hypothetical protein [Myxococcus sp. AM010]